MEKKEGSGSKRKTFTKNKTTGGANRRTDKTTRKSYKKRSDVFSENSGSDNKKKYVKKTYSDDKTVKPKNEGQDENVPEKKFSSSKKTYKEYRKGSGTGFSDRRKFDDKKTDKPYKKYDNNDDKKSTDRPFKKTYKKAGENENVEKKTEYRHTDRKKTYTKSSDSYQERKFKSRFGKDFKKKAAEKKDEEEGIRLNRYIANSGVCSRREADTFISTGCVSVNGEIVTTLGTKVMPGDIVKFNDEPIKNERKVYVLLNKPKDFVTTLKDPHAKRTVMELVDNACKERIYPIGRLDRNTTGVLLLTNDGDMTTKLTHPKNRVAKVYHVYIDKPLTKNDMIKLSEGLELEDGFAKIDKIDYTNPNDKRMVGVEIHSGKNRIVRRLFEALEYKVEKLDRVVFAGLTKKNLKRGDWRFLTEKEVSFLKMLSTK